MVILLQYLNVVENVMAWAKTLDKPGARVGPIAENLSLHGVLMRTRVRDEIFLGHLGVWGERVVECEASRHREQTDTDQWREHARDAHPRGQHRDNFVGPRHPPEREEQGQEQRHR